LDDLPPTETTPFDLSRCIGAITTSLSNKLSSGASQEYRARFDLGVVEWRVLAQLGAEPWSTGAQLSQTIGLDKASISRSLRLLEDRGLIETRSAGGRRQEAALTGEGWAVHGEVLEVARAREARLLEGLTPGEVGRLVELLQRLLANLPGVEADAARRASETSAEPPVGQRPALAAE
jgi:DNA-binding MarR family transcriptional regulator